MTLITIYINNHERDRHRHHTGGPIPGGQYGFFETYVAEPLSHPGHVVALEGLRVIDQGKTVAYSALRVRQVSDIISTSHNSTHCCSGLADAQSGAHSDIPCGEAGTGHTRG